jgi:hypothetical protein
MIALLSLLLILTLSILITRVATIALIHTGLSQQAARFQARSAFTGVGYTTRESEKVVNHPVRRRILMLLMLSGNAGIVTAITSMMLTFVGDERMADQTLKAVLLALGVGALWAATQSKWLDRHLSRIIQRMLKRWTTLDVRDYASLFHLGGDYRVIELRVEKDDWLADHKLRDLNLPDEGVLVLGIQHADGTYTGIPGGDTTFQEGQILLMYGRGETIKSIDARRRGVGGAMAHQAAVAEQIEVSRREEEEAEEADETSQTRPRAEDPE